MNCTVINRIIRVEGNKHFNVDDMQIKESPVSLMLEGVELTRSNITIVDKESKELWALGYLKCNGLIEKIIDISGIDINEDCVEVKINKHVVNICNEPVRVTWKTSPKIIFDSIRWLGSAPLFKATGCTHVAAIYSPEGERLFGAEDIGRHNAVDKVIGWALKENIDFSQVMFMTSGRMPKDMVTKTWAAGIGLMASVSAASTDGIETAKLANITLAGFVRGDRMNIYTDSLPKRIECNS